MIVCCVLGLAWVGCIRDLQLGCALVLDLVVARRDGLFVRYCLVMDTLYFLFSRVIGLDSEF